MKKRIWVIPVVVLALVGIAFAVYVSDYYTAAPAAELALESDAAVQVTKTDYGWLFDGPSTDTALIFYPGAKVESDAYAPFLHLLAEQGIDVCLVDMPFHLAFFGINAADKVMKIYDYDCWYLGGHSLGGAMAASYAADHGDQLAGVVLCAAYPTNPLDAQMTEILLYGSEDTVVNREKIKAGAEYAPDHLVESIIDGGNHAQFGNYGPQKGDGAATISAAEQQAEAADIITETILGSKG